MIRFAKHYFEGINGIEIYPIISLVLFFIIFITMVIIVFKIPKDSIEEISNLPFENDSQNNNYEQS
ncbi:MAG: CcoQ/FixQ family Cbb3-type cytochrome c oxidase assembly chaperone [Bacteroidetes bacterium]|nr:MAG: CcoQ/FixQ family Cbb3-type cytochrome c oxidase assembly chaperone [Bacteroidota bacterium]